MNKNNVYILDSNEAVISKTKELIDENTCVLVKASNGMGFSEITKAL